MGLCGTEDRDRTIRLLWITIKIWIVLRIVVVEAECRAKFGQCDLMSSFCKDREGVLCYVILNLWREELLQTPYTWVVIGGVEFDITCVSLMEIKGTLCRIVKSVLLGKLN